MIKKILKITGITILVLLVLMIVLPIIFKGKIIEKIKSETNNNLNAKVDFKDFGLSLFRSFPDFSLSLDKITVVGIKEFEKDTLLNVGKIYVSIDLMSVIKGQKYEINSIKLEQPTILLKVLKNGKSNWDIAKPSETPAKVDTSTSTSSFKIGLESLEIINANFTYDDAVLNTYVNIKNLNHSLHGDMTADFTTLETKTNIESINLSYGGIKYLNKALIDIKADIDADLKNSKYTFKENEIRLNELYIGFDGFVAMLKNDIDLDLKLNIKKISFKNLLSLVPGVFTKDFKDIQTAGNLKLEGFAKGIYNEKSLPSFGLTLILDNAMFKYPALPKAVNNINIGVKVENPGGSPDLTVVQISKFHFEVGTNPFDIKLNLKTPVSDPQVDAEFKGKLVLNEVKDFYPLADDQKLNGTIDLNLAVNGKMSSVEKQKYEEFKALGQLMITGFDFRSKDFPQGATISKANFIFSPQFVELTEFNSKIGKSDIAAKGKIDNILSYVFKNELLKGKFEINSNLLDLNEFIPQSETTQATTEDTTSLSVIEVPGNIEFYLASKFNKVLLQNMEMTNVVGIIKVKDKELALENLKMNMLEGQLTVTGSYDTKNPASPLTKFSLDINQFDIPKSFTTFVTIQKLAPIAENSTGKFSTKLVFSTLLDNKMMPKLNTLNGEGKLSSSKVVVNNSPTLSKVADALKMDKFKKLELNQLNISYSFKDGKIIVEPFDVKIGNSKAKIGGTNNLDQTIDYVMNMSVPRSEFGSQANSVLNGLVSEAASKGIKVNPGQNVDVDVFITGTFLKPIIKTGLKDAAGNVANDIKDQVKEELDKKKKELEDKAKAEADRVKKEAEDRAKAEADRVKREAEEKARVEAERARAEAERLKREAEEKAKKEAEKKLKDKLKGPF